MTGITATATARERSRAVLSPRARRTLLTIHIVASVGLLGELTGFLAISIRALTTDSPELAQASHELLAMFSAAFGIPLSMITLASGIALGLGTKWGVLRYPWVTAKLLVIVSVILVGALVIGPTNAKLVDGGDEGRELLVIAAAYDVVALTAATALSVFKPGSGSRRRAASR